MEAADALAYTHNGNISEQKVFDLAKMLGEQKKKSPNDYKKLKQAAEEHPTKSLETIEEESMKIMPSKTYSIVLDGKISKLLEDAANKNGMTIEEQLSEALEQILEDRK